MNSLQINNILKRKLGHVFKGVYAIDQIAEVKPSAPAAYVINSKPITSFGEHWLAVYVTSNRKAVYFDSFGRPPRHTQIIKFLKKHSTKRTFSRKIIQNPFTVTCGEHCIVFLSRFYCFKQIRLAVKPYGPNLIKNDLWALKFVTKTYRLNFCYFRPLMLGAQLFRCKCCVCYVKSCFTVVNKKS